jgi:2-phospho-L-lactate/phosphoenolpyruvate guanylyltransferase
MRTLAVLPVKSFTAAKARLSARLGPEEREALAEAMLGDVLEALAGARGLAAIAVVTAEPRAAAAAERVGALVIPDSEGAGQSPAAALGVAHARRAGYERVLLVPGDTPLLRSDELDSLQRRGADAGLGVAIVPDRHGTGTNALLLRPPGAIAPSFGPGSCARHAAAARGAAVAHEIARVPGLEHDVDTPEDLAELARRLDEVEPAVAPRTRASAALAVPTRA